MPDSIDMQVLDTITDQVLGYKPLKSEKPTERKSKGTEKKKTTATLSAKPSRTNARTLGGGHF